MSNADGDSAFNGGRGGGPHPPHLHRQHPALTPAWTEARDRELT
jgi:hypothetical protein